MKAAIFKDNAICTTVQGLEGLVMSRDRALRTKKLGDLMEYIWAITQVMSLNGGSNNNWQKAKQNLSPRLVVEINCWILSMEDLKKRKNNKNWSLLFYELMLLHKTSLNNLLTYDLIKSYARLLHLFNAHIEKNLRDAADELLKFFQNHKIDPYGCIMNQNPSKNVLRDVLYYNSKDYEMMCSNILGSTQSNFAENSKKVLVDYQQAYALVMDKIVNWSMTEPEIAHSNIRQLVCSMRGVKDIPVGSIVLVQTKDGAFHSENTDEWTFARIAEKPEGMMFLLYLTPEESHVSTFSIERILPISKDILHRKFIRDDLIDLEQCVESFTDKALNSAKQYCNKQAEIFLETNGINMELITLGSKKLCRLRHLQELQNTVRVLQLSHSESLKNVRQYIQKLLFDTTKYTKLLDRYKVFQITQDDKLSQLRDVVHEQLYIDEINHYITICNGNIQILLEHKESILSGEQKNKLAEDWLIAIADRMDSFLAQSGFEFSALPMDYISEAPEDFPGVYRNFVLLKRVINSFNLDDDIFGVRKVIERLCQSVYSTIDRFMKEIDICISLELSVPVETLPKTNEEKIVQIRYSSLPCDKIQKLIECVKDKAYLEEMKSLDENSLFTNSDVPKISVSKQTVPISGLAISVLCRSDNEYATALSIWDPTGKRNDALLSLVKAITIGDIYAIESLFASGEVYANESIHDDGGSALHLSCSCPPEIAVPTIEFLLKHPEVNRAALTKTGETILHRLVRFRDSGRDADNPFYSLIQKLSDNELIHLQNNKGESALHLATAVGNSAVVKSLLLNGADANLAENGENTSLHYAVQHKSLGCVLTLLNYSANPTLQNAEGKSAFELAVDLKDDVLIQLFQKLKWDSEKSKNAKCRTTARLGHVSRGSKEKVNPYSLFEAVKRSEDWTKLQRLSRVVKYAPIQQNTTAKKVWTKPAFATDNKIRKRKSSVFLDNTSRRSPISEEKNEPPEPLESERYKRNHKENQNQNQNHTKKSSSSWLASRPRYASFDC